MRTLPLRLAPGQDLRRALEEAARRQGEAAMVLSGMGSLSVAALRFAGKPAADLIRADLELLTLAGSIAPNGSHLHASVADATGRVLGGHVAYGCTVRTTAEILLALLPEWELDRVPDPATGYDELRVRSRE